MTLQKQKKISKGELQELILEVFGTQKALADKLGISEQNLSDKINTRSSKFIKQLKDLLINNGQINKIGKIAGNAEFNSHSKNGGIDEVIRLKAENYDLRKENQELREKLSKYEGPK